MPIRPELRHLYQGERWDAARAHVFARAGGKFDEGKYLGGAHCEECDKIDRDSYFNARTGRLVLVQLGAAHLDHEDIERFYYPGNLRCRCRACHLDRDLEFHKATRSKRKDRARPLLGEVA